MLQIDEVPPVPPLPYGASIAPMAVMRDGIDIPHSLQSWERPSASASTNAGRDTEIDIPLKVFSETIFTHETDAEHLKTGLGSAAHIACSPRESRTVTGDPSFPDISRQAPLPRPKSSKSNPRSSTNTPNASSLLNRLGTNLRKSLRSPAKYHRLDDGIERGIPMERLQDQQAARLQEEGEFMPVAFDISTFEGPAHFEAKPSMRIRPSRRSGTEETEVNANVLEANGQLTGGLGGGMEEVIPAQVAIPLNYRSSTTTAPKSKPSFAKRTASKFRRPTPQDPNPKSQVGQEAADNSGQVIAVEETIVDLSNVEGVTLGPDRSQDIDLIAEDASAKQSFYFPPDPQMPDWRPLPMRPWYLILLICIAIAFVGVAEHLVQASGPQNTGQGLISFTTPNQINDGVWFVWKYLGEILLTSYGVMFQATDFEVRRLEPYYQMSQSTGSIASESLNMDYLTFWSYLIPFKAFKHRQWAVVCSSLSTILSSAVLPVLYSAAVNLNPPRGHRNWQPGEPPIVYKVQMDPAWTRVLEATLLLVIIASGLLLFQQRRKSGLTGDLKGIAGIASMATKSHILNEFRGLDLASHQTIHKQLARRRFILHKGTLWQGEYITRGASGEGDMPKAKNPHPVVLHMPVGFVFMFGLVLYIALIPIIEFNQHANVVTDVAPWFLPLLATLVKITWTNLETGVRMTEPFYHLSCRHAPSSILLLDYTGTIPGYMPAKALFNKHFLLASIGIAALLGEVLTVCVSSFNVDGTEFLTAQTSQHNFNPSGDGETKRSFLISFVLAETIPIVMLVILIFVHILRRHPFLPRQPGTIASVLAFLHQSKMLYDFVVDDIDDDLSPSPIKSTRRESLMQKRLIKSTTLATLKTAAGFLGLEKDQDLDRAERVAKNLQLRGKTYGLGWYRGRDGQSHIGIDEEELLHSYEHGIDYTKSHMEASEIGRWDQY